MADALLYSLPFGSPTVLSTEPTEQSLIQHAIDGDETAFTCLLRQHRRLMLHVARAIVGEHEAEDVVQDASTAAFCRLQQFEGRASIKSWLLAIVSNTAKTRLRKAQRQKSLEISDDLHTVIDDSHFRGNGHWREGPAHWHMESPEALLEEAQLGRCIEATLLRLPPLQKAVFLLRDVEQQPFDDICPLLDISAANARVLIHRARVTFMQMIDRYQETGQC